MAIFNATISGGISSKNCTATSANILEGKTAVVDNEIVTGTMANNGAVGSAIANGVLKEGYTSGGAIANLSAENIKNGVTIAGLVGAYSDEHEGTLTYNIYSASDYGSPSIFDRTGLIFKGLNGKNTYIGTCKFKGNMIMVSGAINSKYATATGARNISELTASDEFLFEITSDNPSITVKK